MTGAAAVDRMERLRELEFDSPELAPGGSLDADAVVGGVAYFDDADPEFVVRWLIADHPTVAEARILTVRAIARRAHLGRAKQATVTTVRGR